MKIYAVAHFKSSKAFKGKKDKISKSFIEYYGYNFIKTYKSKKKANKLANELESKNTKTDSWYGVKILKVKK